MDWKPERAIQAKVRDLKKNNTKMMIKKRDRGITVQVGRMGEYTSYWSIDGDFCLWFDWWQCLPMVWLMTIPVCGLTNDCFFMWFDWWRLFACSLTKWRLLPNGWLIGFITRSGGFCQVSDWWDLSPRNDYFAINWDAILGRMPIIGLIIGSYPRQWYVYWVVSPVSSLIIGSIPLQWLN